MVKRPLQRIRELYEPFSDAEAAIIFGGMVILLSFAAIILSGAIGSEVVYVGARVFFGLGVFAALLGVLTKEQGTRSEAEDGTPAPTR